MTKIYVDADACPVKDEIFKVAERFDLEVILVANSYIRNLPYPKAKMVVVSDGADKADDWICETIQSQDIFITADIPLAKRCTEKGARGVDMKGKIFDQNTIGSALSIRNLMTYLRETGDINSQSKPFSKQDRSQFLQNLDKLLRRKNV